MRNIQLYLGPDRLKIDTAELSVPTISYSIKDIKNFGQKNASFSKPISIYHTANTDRIFKGLFNVNAFGGYDVGVRVYGELQENGITILKGSVQVVSVTLNTYEIILFSNNLSIFDVVGDDLISGNQNALLDLQFDPCAYEHTWSRAHVLQHLNSEPSADGLGYTYPIIDYSGDLRWPALIDFSETKPLTLRDDYLILPAIAAKQIFDKIFDDSGFTYEMSSEIEDMLKKLYIPFNDDYINYTTETYKYGKYYLGNARDLAYTNTTILLTGAWPGWSFFTTETIPSYSVRGWTFSDNYLANPNRVSGGYDYIINRSSTAKSTDTRFILPHRGQYTIDVSLYLFNTSGSVTNQSEWSLSTWNPTDGNVTKSIGSVSLAPSSGGYINATIDVGISEKSSMFIHRSLDSATAVNLVFGPWNYVEITEKNSFIGANNKFSLNNMLPKNYKKADFINDIFKMFNAFITVDTIDEKKVYIKTFKDFYSTGQLYDWTQKIDNDSIKFSPIKNNFAKNTYFTFTNDNDIYSQDYLSKFTRSIYTEEVKNDSEFGTADVEITLAHSPGVITLVPFSTALFGNPKPPTGGARILSLTDEKQYKTTWKPRLLFPDSVDVSAFLYGSDASTAADPYIRKWNTLGPRMSSNVSSSDNLFLGFNSVRTYTTGVNQETNETLYNRYYKADVESNLDDQSYLLEAKFYLTSEDIAAVSFDDIIKIDHSKLGNAFYRLNAVKDYTPGEGLTTVELLKINLVDDSYDTSINTNIVFKSVTGEGGTPGSGGGSGSGGTPTTAGTLQDVTDEGNTTTNDIVLVNAFVPSAQVALGANADEELTIDGTSIEDKFMHQVDHVANRLVFTDVNGDASSSANYTVDGITNVKLLTTELYGGSNQNNNDFKITSNANLSASGTKGITIDPTVHSSGTANITLGGAGTNRINLLRDTSVANSYKIITEDLWGKTPFVSGFTGTGYQITKTPQNTYRLEVDDLLVRGKMNIYELIINKIRATNGSLWVADAVEAIWPGESSTYIPAGMYIDGSTHELYFYSEIGLNTLEVDDIVRSQQFLGSRVHVYDWVVTAIESDKVYVEQFEPTSRIDGTNMSLVNISADEWFHIGSQVYDIEFRSSPGSFRTAFFNLEGGGRVNIQGEWEYSEGVNITFTLVDPSYNALSDSSTLNTSAEMCNISLYLNDFVSPDASVCIKIDVAGEELLEDFAIGTVDDYGIPNLDVTNYTFVRRGSLSNSGRRGALFLTSSEPNSPYMEVIDDMTTPFIQPANRKVRIGKLDGLSWNDTSIGGYGLWTSNGYFEGGINANYGNIGNFTIEDGQLVGTGIAGDQIIINPDDPGITITDASNAVVAEFTNNPIRTIASITSGTEISYTGSAATQYTDLFFSMEQGNVYQTNTTRYLEPSIYVANYGNSNSTLDASLALWGANRYIAVEEDVTFKTDMYVNITQQITLPPDDPNWYGQPIGPPENEWDEIEIITYSTGGTWTVDSCAWIYDGQDTLLNTHSTSLTATSGNRTNWRVINSKNILPTDASVYIKWQPRIKSDLYGVASYRYWYAYAPYWYEPDYLEWELGYQGEFYFDPSISWQTEINSLSLNGRIQKTQIGQDGILTYWDSDKYFTVNNGVSPLIQSAGSWAHNLGNSGYFRISHGGETASFGSPLALACNEQGWMSIFANKRNANDGGGILLDAGNGSSTAANLMMFRTYNGNEVGKITHNSTNTTYGSSSDERLKDNIRDASIDAIALLNDIPVREWEWNVSGENDLGFVAQEVLEVYPRMVQIPNDPSTEYYGVGSQHLVPVLVKAVQELSELVKELQLEVSILKSS